MKTTFDKLINGEKPVLIDFFATWCGPCKAMSPILGELVSDIGEHVRVVKIDVDKNQPLAQKLKVRGVPTLALFVKGELVWRESGVRTKHQLKQIIEQFISTNSSKD